MDVGRQSWLVGFNGGGKLVPLLCVDPKMTCVFGFLVADDNDGNTNFLKEKGEWLRR